MSPLARARRTAAWALATPGRLGLTIAAAVVAAAMAGLFFAWTGAYNIAASRGHLAITEWLLRFGMENSVKARAPDGELPPGFDADRVRLGAGHFHAGCAYCHGTPGSSVPLVAAQMLPPPPALEDKVGTWTDGELFWIVKHGLKYAGMPAFPSVERDDEIWAVVAFLRRFPELDRTAYRKLALGEVDLAPPSGAEIAATGGDREAIGACARCHGNVRAPASGLVPILHGQPREMLENALREYAAGRRDSGVMQTIAADLSDAAIRALASHYAGMPRPVTSPERLDPQAVARGEKLAREGDPSHGVPACVSCHNEDASPTFPRLAGQSSRYLEGQLAAWRAGLNARSPTGRIMAPIGRRLTAEQAKDLAAYFAGQTPAGQVHR
ncbi:MULTISPECIES: c-type cytochrome [unclassified Chelatococcus]|uniref:c-type cytochrome n=1 Tax=unclassified Chelatococcus TaxID=2638111 RepID=UPI001BCF3C74|nr:MULTISPECIES: c-type cytochrome [unclassified Chelatococcus]MBS7699937.1 c-type cytochrome [Chelatococcus sp. YT9]MBX3558638.1 c-type cytochrome [Chelatococcus sp.]